MGSHRRWSLVGSGVCLGAATLVKQVAIVPAVVFVAALAWRAWSQEDRMASERSGAALLDVVSFGLGLVSILAVAATILIARGAGRSAAEDIFHYGRALATDTLPEPNAPLAVIRWITGNADPAGRLPWPFGTTDYLVWWGTGSWPLWLVSIPALAYLLLAPRQTPRAASGRGLDSGGLGPGRPPGPLLAALLPLADRRRGRSRWRSVWPTRLRFWVVRSRRTPTEPPGANTLTAPVTVKPDPSRRSCWERPFRRWLLISAYRRDVCPRGPRLPARVAPGADDSIQRRAAVGCLA